MRYFEILIASNIQIPLKKVRKAYHIGTLNASDKDRDEKGNVTSQRYGVFFSDNPKFAALYGNVKKYVLNIQDTADLNTPHIRREFIESLDPFDPVDRPFWLTVRHATGQTWQLFEDQLGERFTKFLLDNGYDSATFTEYNEDSEGNEFKSNTIVVLKPELIREISINESASKPKFLYHGTSKKNAPSIMASGVEPRVGNYVKNWYGKKSKEPLVPVVFGAEKRHMLSCVLAMFAAIQEHHKLDPKISLDEFLSLAALVVLPSDSFIKASLDNVSQPIQVEKKDWYSTVPVIPVKVIIDQELRPLVGEHFQRAKIEWFGKEAMGGKAWWE